MRSAVFFDRDGVLIENCPEYVRDWNDVKFFPAAFEALRLVRDRGMLSIVVTNQAIVGKGILSREHIEALHSRIVDEFNRNDAPIEKSYLCPHTDSDACDCRKPKPGMLLQAAREFEIDLTESLLVGDAVSDIQAGIAAGTRAILVRTGRGAVQEMEMDPLLRSKCAVADNVLQAVQTFLQSGVTR